MKRARPKLSPEYRQQLSEKMKRRHADDPGLRHRIGRAAANTYARKARDPEYRAWRRELAFEARLDPKRGINQRAAMKRRWSDPQQHEAASKMLRRLRADPEFNRLTQKARWTPRSRAAQGQQKRSMWSARRDMVAELCRRGRLRRNAKKPGTIAAVILSVLAARGITLDQLLEKTRRSVVSEARADIARRLRAKNFSYPVIGRALGLDHTTIMYAVKKQRVPA